MKNTFVDRYDAIQSEKLSVRALRKSLLIESSIIDENMSVKWNRDEVRKRNEELKDQISKKLSNINTEYLTLLLDLKTYYKELYPFITDAGWCELLNVTSEELSYYGFNEMLDKIEEYLDLIGKFVR